MKWLRRPGPKSHEWHRHFAWTPVPVPVGRSVLMVWLEHVERMDWSGPPEVGDTFARSPQWIYRLPVVPEPPLRQSVVRMGDTTVRLPQNR